MRPWLFIGVPCLVLAVGIFVALSNILEPPTPKPVSEPSAKEVAARILPKLDSNLKVDANRDIEVVEIKIEHTGGSRVVGTVRNNTGHEIPAAHMVVDFTDINGSQVGSVEVCLENIPASKVQQFSTPIAQHAAAFALVREVGPVQ